ncbi:MAG TPA: GYD domain-containing protein [Tepidisphaeraceae bacterium]|nr:GYD domain-containing protein [Tepidisphaeraceae bacterium]
MVRHLVLFKFTDQGVRNLADTLGRAEAFNATAQKVGGSVKVQYWTVGRYDGAIVLEAPDEQTATALLANLAKLGNVRTESLRAFDRADMEPIIAKMR